MKRWLFGLGLACGAFSAPAQVDIPGQQQGGPSLSTGTVPLTYTGADNRVSVGIDQDGHSQGELLGVFGNNGERAYVGQFWWGYGGAGGVQLDYNWLFGTTLEQARRDPDSISVAKLSFAVDQDAERNRMANVGLAYERKEFFLNFYLAGKISNPHQAGSINDSTQTVATGTDENGNFTQTITNVTTTALEAQPYSYTVGVHGGHFSDPLTARFNGGFDYSRGKDGANEKRLSISVDKYIGVRGWSISAMAEHAETSAPVGNGGSDNRAWMFLRYEFGGGGAFRSPADTKADSAWIERALHEPVTGHPRTFTTYTTKATSTTKTIPGPKTYTARFPVARDDAASVAENSAGNAINVLANDSDPDGGALSVSSVGAPAHGTAQASGNQVVYTPARDYVGSDTFPYTVTTSKGLSASANVVVTVTQANQPPPSGNPVARDDSATTPYATPVTITVLANDSDPANYPLSVTGSTSPEHGTAHVNADNSITYTPNPTFTGSDRFSYTVGNGHGGSAGANVTVTVQPPLPPIARNDTASTSFQTPVNVDVLANDSSPSGFTLSISSVGSAAHGVAQINPGGTVTYTPAPLFSGQDSFSYSISDGHGGSASATVTVTVEAPVTTLTPQNDTAATAYATPVNINVLANDQGPPGSVLTVKSVTAPAHGTAQIGSGGIVIYTPSPSFNGGADTFNYTVSDGPDSAVAIVTVTVQAPGAPVAQNDTASTAFGTPVAISVLGNDSDPNSLPLTVTQVTAPAHGSAAINPNNTITYTPQAGYAGADSFKYVISNGHGGTASATVSVTVGAPPQPVANNDTATTAFNKAVAINVLQNDSDPSSFPLAVTQASAPAHGSAQINGDNTITYTPQTNYFGPDQFTYTIGNGHGGTANATVNVTVQAPLPPVAVNDSATTPFGNAVKVSVLANDSDPNGLPLAVVSVTPSTGGLATVVINTDNTVTYTPNPEQSPGPDSFTYTISDGFNQATATVNVTMQAPLSPIAVKDTYTLPFNTPTPLNVLANDSDPQGLSLIVIGWSSPSHGTLSSDGFNLTYTPGVFTPPGSPVPVPYVGVDTFTYTISNGTSAPPATATVTVTVSLPPPPIANDDTASAAIGNITNIAVVQNDFDSQGLPLRVAGVSQPTGGLGASTTINQDGVSIDYSVPDSPPAVDTFTYTIRDPYGQTASAKVTVNVN